MKSSGPILTAHLFPVIEQRLIELLMQLTEGEWELQTISPRWKVKDVAAHLLDTQLRKLSLARDGYSSQSPVIRSDADLGAFINRLNDEGVSMYRRLSPPVLISLMEVASNESAEYHQSLDPFAPAAFSVSWAGEDESLNWFDTARELTERWHHQQQIRLAVNRPGIMIRELYYPVLDCFMRALPHAYREIEASPETLLAFEVSGDCGGVWQLLRASDSWTIVTDAPQTPASRVIVPQEIAWRIFTKGISREQATQQIRIDGDRELGSHLLNVIAIVG